MAYDPYSSVASILADFDTRLAIGGSVTLNALSISPTTATVGTAYSGTVTGKTASSVLSLTGAGAAGLNASGSTVTGTPTTAGAVNIVETLAGATNSPRTSSAPLTVSVTVTLGALTLSGTLNNGTVSSGSINGATSGSSIASNVAGLTVNSGARTYSFDGSAVAGTTANGLVETLAGATNSPRSSAITVIAAAQTLVAIPATSSAPAAIYAMRKVTPDSTYSGPLFRLVRASDSATMDVSGTTSGGLPDYAAIDTWAGGAVTTIDIRYDQSGNGRHATQTVAANRPLFTNAVVEAGVRPMTQDYYINATATAKWMNIPAFSLNRTDFGVYQVHGIRNGNDKDIQFSFQNDAVNGDHVALFTQSAGLCTSGTSVQQTATFPRARVQGICYSGRVANEIVFINGVKKTLTARTAQAMTTGGRDGGTFTASFPVKHSNHATIIYSTAPTDTDVAALDTWQAQLVPANLPTPTRRVVWSGSSLISAWYQADAFTPPYTSTLGASTDIVNMGQGGRTLAAEYAARAAVNGLITGGIRNVLVIDAPSNDLVAQTFTDQASAEAWADALYNNTTLPYVAAAKTAVFYGVVVPTLIVRGLFTTANFREFARLRYNTLVTGGATANGYKVSDRAADTRLSNFANTTYFFTDQIHLTKAGGIALREVEDVAIEAAFA